VLLGDDCDGRDTEDEAHTDRLRPIACTTPVTAVAAPGPHHLLALPVGNRRPCSIAVVVGRN
jgi:hypothetical protein